MVSVRHFCWCQYLVLCPARLAPPPSPTRPSCSLAHCSDFPEQRQPWCLLPTPDGQSVWSSPGEPPSVLSPGSQEGQPLRAASPRIPSAGPGISPATASSPGRGCASFGAPACAAQRLPSPPPLLRPASGSKCLISVPPLVSWQLLCSFAHVELGPSGSPLDLEWIHSACVDPSS